MYSNENVSALESLPDEVLLFICTKLAVTDLINLTKVCKRFLAIVWDKSVTKRVDFSLCGYNLTDSTVNDILMCKERWRNIRILNMNSCYWLSSSVLAKIAKLKELEELNVLGCKLTLPLLRKIVSNKNLISLSFSWPLVSSIDYFRDIAKSFARLKLPKLRNVEIEVRDLNDFTQIGHFICLCENLETVSVYLLSQFLWARSAACGRGRMSAKSVKRVNILIPDDLQESPLLLSICLDVFLDMSIDHTSLEEICLNDHGCIVWQDFQIYLRRSRERRHNNSSWQWLKQQLRSHTLASLQNGLQSKCRMLSLDSSDISSTVFRVIADNCRQLTRLSARNCNLNMDSTDVLSGIRDVCISCSLITELDLSFTHIHSNDENPCSHLANLKGLRKLAIPACMVAMPRLQPRAHVKDGMKRQRMGAQKMTEQSDLKLWVLTENCPHLIELKICGRLKAWDDHSRCEMCCDGVYDETLSCISRWNALQKLTLSDIRKVSDGRFLLDITKNCRRLRSLQLVHIANQSGVCPFQNALMECLSDAPSLKDLSVIHCHFRLNQRFCEKLATCKTLERLLIFTSDGPDRELCDAFFRAAIQLHKLFVIYVKLNLCHNVCGQLSRLLESLAEDRPALNVFVGKIGEVGFPRTCAAVHVKDLSPFGYPNV